MTRIPPPEHRLNMGRIARMLGRDTSDVRKLLREGSLVGWKTATGRWWTTHDEIARFLGIDPSPRRRMTAAEEMAEALR